jgi:hypothetical protein
VKKTHAELSPLFFVLTKLTFPSPLPVPHSASSAKKNSAGFFFLEDIFNSRELRCNTNIPLLLIVFE